MKYRIFIIVTMISCTALLHVGVAAGEVVVPNPVLSKLECELKTAMKGSSSSASQRLALRRLARNVSQEISNNNDKPERWELLELLFRVQQQLIKLDDSEEYRKAMLETCQELVKAPKQQAHLAFEADLLLSLSELVRRGAQPSERAATLRILVQRYIETKQGAKALRVVMAMALELGDAKLIGDLSEMMTTHFSADPEMISFQRDKLAGQVFGASFAGAFKRSDGKILRFPMHGFGRPTLLFFWSNDEKGLTHLKDLAQTMQKLKESPAGRMDVIGFNLDDLPDAGEAIVRGLGLNWQCMHLPGGRKHAVYNAYARRDPLAIQVSPTGQVALVMQNGGGAGRFQTKESDTPDYESMLTATLGQKWVQHEYCAQLVSLSAGDFMVFDPEGNFDPYLPPELKTVQSQKAHPLERGSDCVPLDKLQAIQNCFIAPPLRYQISEDAVLAAYNQSVELCRHSIDAHPKATDLWLVRNRLIVSLMGLWKANGDLKHLDEATEEARIAIEAGFPDGGDVVARFCLARKALCYPNADPREIVDRFVADSGGDKASGLALAAAAVLSMDVADRIRYKQIRETILKQHADHPMTWIFSAFLVDRAQQYWLYQMPFHAGDVYERRASYYQLLDQPEDARRVMKAELRTADGQAFRIPEDLTADYTAFFFSVPEPWGNKYGDDLYQPTSTALSFAAFTESRPLKDSQAVFVILGEKPHMGKLSDHPRYKATPSTMLALPDGLNDPLVSRIGILATNRAVNSVLVDKKGRILSMVSGLTKRADRGGYLLTDVVARLDMLKTINMLERGEIEAAKKFIFTLAPPHNPNAVDANGKPVKKPRYRLSHLRARARVYMAMGEWDKALADAEEVCAAEFAIDRDMSMRTEQSMSDEDVRNDILEKSKPKLPSSPKGE